MYIHTYIDLATRKGKREFTVDKSFKIEDFF